MSGYPPHSGVVPPPPSWQQTVVGDDWPRRDALELGSLLSAVPCARLHARHILREWGLAHLAEDAELLVSELMTNAIAASRATDEPAPVWLWLLADSIRVLVMVWDASPEAPVQPGSGPGDDGPGDDGADDDSGRDDEDAENGRGLLLVEAISQQWDWYHTENAAGKAGKVVWALLQAGLD
jgi:anti-sigma regulatory factor (Ser/Thr protein kinase)